MFIGSDSNRYRRRYGDAPYQAFEVLDGGGEQAWSEQFAGVLAAASQAPGQSGAGYRPRWYSGRGFHERGVSDFASSLGGSFSGAIAASSTAPGSSSGSGGGGSSGGGGGSGW